MSVPLDRLYHYLADVVNHDLVIYRWLPHGSRKLEDLDQLTTYSWAQYMHRPLVICHDQEPLSHDFYSDQLFKKEIKQIFVNAKLEFLTTDQILQHHAALHFRGCTSPANIHDQYILLHSEKSSQEVSWFARHGCVPVYYWSHALIAKDWFRYAEHDPMLSFDKKKIAKDFLIYNRAWGGTREYRLAFINRLIAAKLDQHCQTSFSPYDNQQHYTDHQFQNPQFSIDTNNIEHILPSNMHDSSASADYNQVDYQSTGIEIVLETLFDDQRQHLTEKTLRPIACKQPFLLAASPGSLNYLKSYGFETFSKYIDESYDTVVDSSARLDAIIAEMNRIQQLAPDQKHQLLLNLDQICQRNQQRFFSKEFQNYITQEFVNNMQAGIDTVQNSKNGTISKQCYQLYQQVPEYHTWAMQNNSIRSVQEQQQFIKLFESNV